MFPSVEGYICLLASLTEDLTEGSLNFSRGFLGQARYSQSTPCVTQ